MTATRALGACALAAGLASASAQSIEPRAYANAPVGVNFLIAGYAQTRGGLSFDPSAPLSDAHLNSYNGVFAYARVLDLWGQSGKIDAVVPYARLAGTANFAGQPVERVIDGFADASFRLSVNLYGAPALTLKEFAKYQQDVIFGASLQVTVPSSQYDAARLLNIGTHRWSFKPELGLSKAIDRWTLEGKAAVTLYTDNNDFLGSSTRSQEPLFSIQGHVIYNFASNVWASLDATYFAGGRTSINGTLSNDLQQNWRLGATMAVPVDIRNAVKFYASRGVSARTGNNFDLLGLAWQYRWGGGL